MYQISEHIQNTRCQIQHHDFPKACALYHYIHIKVRRIKYKGKNYLGLANPKTYKIKKKVNPTSKQVYPKLPKSD